MIRKALIPLLILTLLTAALPAAAAGPVSGLTLRDTPEGVAFDFQCEQFPYLLLVYKTADESGKIVLTGRDGHYAGVIPLPHRQKAGQIKAEIRMTSGKPLTTTAQTLAAGRAPEKRYPEAGAVGKISVGMVPGERRMGFSFDAPGHHQAVIRYSSVTQQGEYVLEETGDGHFEDTLDLPFVNARDLVTVTVSSVRGRQLGKAQERTLFVPPESGETAAEGPLKGVRICIDPGHQEVGVKWGRVKQFPGTDKLVPGGDSTMAQGKVTLRKESICVLEISYRLCRRLRALGADVVMTRWTEQESLTNMERAEYANAQGADYHLRIHLNASDEGTNNAVYVYGPVHSEYARAALPFEQYRDTAQTILDGLKAATGVQGGVVRMSDQFVGNNWSKMPAFLLECGFLSTPANDWILTTDDYQEKIARGIADGMVAVAEGRLSRFTTN